jgi:hypothetical protein
MKHEIHTITRVQVIGPWMLRIAFGDGSQRDIDFAPILVGELYGPLQDETLFNQVRVDPEIRTIVWPNGADFDPATLHDWPDYEVQWRARAQSWARVAEGGEGYVTKE